MENVRVAFLCTAVTHSSAQRRLVDARRFGWDISEFHSGVDKNSVGALRRLASLTYLRMLYFALSGNFDVLWCWGHDAAFVGSVAALLRRRTKVIWDISDVSSLLLGDSLLARFLRCVERSLINRASGVFLTSLRFYTEYFRYIVDTTPVFVIENKWGDAPRVPSLFSCTGERIRIVYAGLFRTAKVVDLVRSVCSVFSDSVVFDFVGRADDSDTRVALEGALTLENVRYRGPYKHTDVADVYQGASLVWGMVDPDHSINEVWLLPNRLYDSIATGVPIIGTKGTATGDYIEESGIGYSVLLDHDEVCACLARILANREALSELAASMPPRGTAYLAGEYGKALLDVSASR
jgi:succinoglycan biosynthesis protein ExoL